jgi:hypothetical protein
MTELIVDKIADIWSKYQVTEDNGLELGKLLYEYPRSSGGCGSRKTGLVQLLDTLSIPRSTAYWWIDRYKESVGLKIKQEREGNVVAYGGFWEDLYNQLSPLSPSITDGYEHKTVEMLEKSPGIEARTQAEQNFRRYVIRILSEISSNFAVYAQRLRDAEVA